MKYRTIRAAEMKTSDWSGGRTTEIFIHPEGSNVSARDFEVRVSTATVELDESTFSDYKGYIRRIMPVEGSFELTIDEQDPMKLARLETTTFDGGRRVRSKGKCRDFNVIHKPRWLGGLRAANAGDAFDCPAPGFSGIYALCTVKITIEQDGKATVSETLAHGDALIVTCGGNEAGTVRVKLTDAQGQSEGVAVAFIAGD